MAMRGAGISYDRLEDPTASLKRQK